MDLISEYLLQLNIDPKKAQKIRQKIIKNEVVKQIRKETGLNFDELLKQMGKAELHAKQLGSLERKRQLKTVKTPNELYRELFGTNEFIGAQPLQFLSNDMFRMLRNKSCRFSPKLDGVRYLCQISDQHISLFSRGNKTLIFDGPKTDGLITVLDVELVTLENKGNCLFAFDILVDKSKDVRSLSYLERRKLLEKRFQNVKQMGEFKFFINESYSIDYRDLSYIKDKKDDYQKMFDNIFWKSLRNMGLRFDGVVLYDVNYPYPVGVSPAHYGTWKWKPREELTIDLRMVNGKATIPKYDKKTNTLTWKDVKESFDILQIENVTLRDQEPEQSYEFRIEEMGNGKLKLVGKMPRDKTSNTFMSIQSTITAFRENIKLETLKSFYKQFVVFKEPRGILTLRPVNFDLLKRMAYVSMTNSDILKIKLTQKPVFNPYQNLKIDLGELRDYGTQYLQLLDERDTILAKLGEIKPQGKEMVTSLRTEFNKFKTTMEYYLQNAREHLQEVVGSEDIEPLIDEIGVLSEMESSLHETYETTELKSLDEDYIQQLREFNRFKRQLLKNYDIKEKKLPEIKGSINALVTIPNEIEMAYKRLLSDEESLNTRLEQINLELFSQEGRLPLRRKPAEIETGLVALKWFYKEPTNNEILGPFTNREMRERYQRGIINADTLVTEQSKTTDFKTIVTRFPTLKRLFPDKEFRIEVPRDNKKEFLRYQKSLHKAASQGISSIWVSFNFGHYNAQLFYQLLHYCRFEHVKTIMYGKSNLRLSYDEFETFGNHTTKLKSDKYSFFYNCKLELREEKRFSYNLKDYKSTRPVNFFEELSMRTFQRKVGDDSLGVDEYEAFPNWLSKTPWFYYDLSGNKRPIYDYKNVELFYGPGTLRLMKMENAPNKFEYRIELGITIKNDNDKNFQIDLFPLLSQLV